MNPSITLVNELTHKLIACTHDEMEAQQEAWWILQFVTKQREADLLFESKYPLNQAQQEQLASIITRRVEHHEPLQYIIGTVPFLDLDLLVRPPVLIPRPETEEWTDWLIRSFHQLPRANYPKRILDLCSGSGCIALALARAFPESWVVGTDINPDAIALATENARRNNIANAQFLAGDLFIPVIAHQGEFDLIVSNPPYISEEDWQLLDASVRTWEDKIALVATHHGLRFYERIAQEAAQYLAPQPSRPCLVVEIGYQQGNDVAMLFTNASFSQITVHKDMEGKDRWVSACKM